ncbi:MAG TPA: hypothetical protein VN581_12400 [Patescibacteria group bacterium]|nr:hypothetical protein [Patescibacteria group bacterium]
MSLSRRDCLRFGLAAGAATLTSRFAIASASPLRLALYGCGPRGLALAVSALRCTADVELVAIADPDAGRAARAAAWWQHPAQRASLRACARLQAGAVLSGASAAATLAALTSVDVVLMADDASAQVRAIGRRHVCLWPGRVDAALRQSLQAALLDAAEHGRVFSVHAPQFEVAAAHSGATLRARTLSRFFQDIRQGQCGDVDGRVAALLAAPLTSQA